MLPIVFSAMITHPDTEPLNAHGPEIIEQSCGHRMVSDVDLDLGRQLLIVVDVYTDDVIYTVEIDDLVAPMDAAAELDLCALRG